MLVLVLFLHRYHLQLLQLVPLLFFLHFHHNRLLLQPQLLPPPLSLPPLAAAAALGPALKVLLTQNALHFSSPSNNNDQLALDAQSSRMLALLLLRKVETQNEELSRIRQQDIERQRQELIAKFLLQQSLSHPQNNDVSSSLGGLLFCSQSSNVGNNPLLEAILGLLSHRHTPT